MIVGSCPYCDGPMPHPSRDHIVSKRLGGNRGPHNIIRVCRACNQVKGDMTPDAMRSLAEEMEYEASVVRKIADRVDALITERGLLPGSARAALEEGEGEK